MHTLDKQAHDQHSKPNKQNKNILKQHIKIRSDKMGNRQITNPNLRESHMMKTKTSNLNKFKINQQTPLAKHGQRTTAET